MNNVIKKLEELKYFDIDDIDKIMSDADLNFDYDDFKFEYGFVSSEDADEMIKYEGNNSSMDRMVCFLAKIERINQDYYYLNGYENLENVTPGILECFRSDLIKKIKEEY